MVCFQCAYGKSLKTFKVTHIMKSQFSLGWGCEALKYSVSTMKRRKKTVKQGLEECDLSETKCVWKTLCLGLKDFKIWRFQDRNTKHKSFFV